MSRYFGLSTFFINNNNLLFGMGAGFGQIQNLRLINRNNVRIRVHQLPRIINNIINLTLDATNWLNNYDPFNQLSLMQLVDGTRENIALGRQSVWEVRSCPHIGSCEQYRVSYLNFHNGMTYQQAFPNGDYL